ncbi:hypothetical protein GIB67_016807 [Kingdonia uniflora]|uniref:Uncharacterized protein n=1 Tax=Kingdonia uniflora TaxID=39325 RepID=A0A7J7LRR8_9MAGN|nr:hypothetical protein GIB67_016807 [Kingdonia uniflora]
MNIFFSKLRALLSIKFLGYPIYHVNPSTRLILGGDLENFQASNIRANSRGTNGRETRPSRMRWG